MNRRKYKGILRWNRLIIIIVCDCLSIGLLADVGQGIKPSIFYTVDQIRIAYWVPEIFEIMTL